MPYKPKRPCATRLRSVAEREQYCAEHQKVMDKYYNQFQRDLLPTAVWPAWKRIRDRYIKAHPLCEECEKQGKLTAAEEVHHKLPLSKGGNNERSNLMALCKSCHSRITAESGDRW